MLARITPSPLKGTVPAIASKSMAHRLIICAALANGETHVTCNTTCADIEATVRCLTALGARIETVEDGFQVHPTMKSVEFGLLKALAGGTLDCGESGSTLRFMLPVACALGADATFVGQGRLGAPPALPALGRDHRRRLRPTGSGRFSAQDVAAACARAPLCFRAT